MPAPLAPFATAAGVVALAVSSVLPLITALLWTELPVAAAFALLVCNAAFFSAVLVLRARPAIPRTVGLLPFAALAVPALEMVVTDRFPMLSVIAWPAVYIGAWSAVRRAGVGVVSLLVAIGVVLLGYVAIFGIVFTLALDGRETVEPAVIVPVAVTALAIVGLANGAIWLDEVLRTRRSAPGVISPSDTVGR